MFSDKLTNEADKTNIGSYGIITST